MPRPNPAPDWPAVTTLPEHVRKKLEVSDGAASGAAAICILDSGGSIVDPSPDYCRLVGYVRSELIGRHWSTTVPEEKLAQAQREFARFHALGASSGLSAVRRKDGTEITGICLAVRIADDRYAAAFLRLNERDGRWDAWCRSYDCVPCPIVVLNLQGVVLFGNDAATALMNVCRSELVGRGLADFLPGVKPDEIRQILERVDLHGMRQGTWALRGVEGQELTAECYITRMPDSDYLITVPKIFGWPDALFTLQATEVTDDGAHHGPSVFQHGDVVIDVRQRRIWRAGTPVSLTPTEFSVLQILVENRERVIPGEEILGATWSETDRASIGLVRTVISRLRAKIEEDHTDPRYIVTVPGRGYAFFTGGAPRKTAGG